MTPDPGKMKQPGIMSAERTRKILRPWLKEEVILYRTFFYRQKGCIWLTPKGLKYAQLNLRYYEPSPSTLPHLYPVNEGRLLMEACYPKGIWRAEQELRAHQTLTPKATPPPPPPHPTHTT